MYSISCNTVAIGAPTLLLSIRTRFCHQFPVTNLDLPGHSPRHHKCRLAAPLSGYDRSTRTGNTDALRHGAAARLRADGPT